MNGDNRGFAELAQLIAQMSDETIAPADLARLEAMLLDNPAAQRFYHEYIALGVDLSWMPIEAVPAPPAVPEAPVLPLRRTVRAGRRIWLAASVTAAALAACVVLAIGWFGAGLPSTDEDAARVVALIGDVGLISPAGNMVPLTEGEQIAPGQIVSTGREDSLVTLEYPNATRVTLGTDSLAQLPGNTKAAPDTSQRVFLFRGFLRAELPAVLSGNPLVLASAHAEVAADVAAEGRQVNFWAWPEQTRVESPQGQLKLTRRRDRHTVSVQTGSYIVVSAETPELKPQRLPAATKPRLVLREGTGPVHSIAFTADGTGLATGGWKGEVKFWNVLTGDTMRPTLVASKSPIRALALSPDNKFLAAAVDEKDRLKLWDLATGKPARPLKGHRARVHALVFAGDGTLISLAGNPQVAEMKRWDPLTHAFRADMTGHASRINGGALSADGQTLATASLDRSVKIWNMSDGKVVRALAPQQGEVFAVALSRDGTLLASGGRDGSVALWDVITGQERRRWQANPRGIKSLDFSPDGSLLATAGDHPDAKLWDVATGREVAAFRSRGHAACAARFSPDGRTLAVADWAAAVTLWEVPVR